jgi:hypothetical protein
MPSWWPQARTRAAVCVDVGSGQRSGERRQGASGGARTSNPVNPHRMNDTASTFPRRGRTCVAPRLTNGDATLQPETETRTRRTGQATRAFWRSQRPCTDVSQVFARGPRSGQTVLRSVRWHHLHPPVIAMTDRNSGTYRQQTSLTADGCLARGREPTIAGSIGSPDRPSEEASCPFTSNKRRRISAMRAPGSSAASRGFALTCTTMPPATARSATGTWCTSGTATAPSRPSSSIPFFGEPRPHFAAAERP